MNNIVLRGLALIIFSAICVNYPIVPAVLTVVALIAVVMGEYNEKKK